MSGLVQQTTAAFQTSLSIDLLTSASVSAIGSFGASGQLVNSYSLAFTLTTASLMHLIVQPSGGGDICSSFSGPQASPDFMFFLSDCYRGVPLDQSFIVAPGKYTLDVRDELRAAFSPQDINGTHEQASDDFSLTADFTAVPEPRWTIIVPALICTLLALVLRQKHAPPSRS